MEVIIAREVSKKFRDKIILDNVNLFVNSGNILGILGPSGSGKSVLIKILIGFLKPDSGEIETKAKIGFSMQNNALYENLTLQQNLKYFAKMYNVEKPKDKINLLLQQLSLENYRNITIGNISGGTKKRADIACALLNDPEVLVLDEPFAGLDTFLVNQLSDLLKQLQQKGMTIILSSHLLNQVESLCTALVFINEGKAKSITKEQLKKLY